MEDVVDLGDELEVRVDDIDPNGKISLTPLGDDAPAAAAAGSDTAERSGGEVRQPVSVSAGPETISFEDAFDAEAREAFGDLGPAGEPPAAERSSDRRGSDRRGDRRPRRH